MWPQDRLEVRWGLTAGLCSSKAGSQAAQASFTQITKCSRSLRASLAVAKGNECCLHMCKGYNPEKSFILNILLQPYKEGSLVYPLWYTPLLPTMSKTSRHMWVLTLPYSTLERLSDFQKHIHLNLAQSIISGDAARADAWKRDMPAPAFLKLLLTVLASNLTSYCFQCPSKTRRKWNQYRNEWNWLVKDMYTYQFEYKVGKLNLFQQLDKFEVSTPSSRQPTWQWKTIPQPQTTTLNGLLLEKTNPR